MKIIGSLIKIQRMIKLQSRLIITKASKITLANLLSLMGMSSPERCNEKFYKF